MSGKCAKCKLAERVSCDTWCLGCSGWEAIERELVSRWPGPAGLRAVAENLVVGAAREVRALRALSAGLGRAQGEPRAGTPAASAAGEAGAGGSRASAGLAPKSAPKPVTPPAADEGSHEDSYTYETDPEEEEAAVEDKRKPLVRAPAENRGGSRRDTAEQPPLKRTKEEKRSEERPREEKRESRREEEEGRRSRDREPERRSEEREDKKKKKSKKKHKRAGRKHKRLGRLAEDPYKEIHRGLPSQYLDQRPSLPDSRERKQR